MIDNNHPQYWNELYKQNKDRWNLNSANPLFVRFLREEKFISPKSKILILGSGKGFDALEAAKLGHVITSLDFSSEANHFARKLFEKENLSIEIITQSIFDMKKNVNEKYDLVYEYVTFCSLDQSRLEEAIENTAAVINPNGILLTFLFPIDDRVGGPPFAININHFHNIAKKYLKLIYFDRRINSIKPRKGNEVLMIYRKNNG